MDNPDQITDASALERTKKQKTAERRVRRQVRKERHRAARQTNTQTMNDQSSSLERRRARKRAKRDKKRSNRLSANPVQHPMPVLKNFHYQLPPSFYQPPLPERFERNKFGRQIDIRPTRYDYDRNDDYMMRRKSFTRVSRDSRDSWDSRRDNHNNFRSQNHGRRSMSPQRHFDQVQYNREHDTHIDSVRRYNDSPPPIRAPNSSKELIKHQRITTQFASSSYLKMADVNSVKLEDPSPKLLVLDLNGTLVYRTNNKKNIMLRPHMNKFMQYIFESNSFVVMVWSSAQPYNVDRMVKAAFGWYENKLAAKWTRKHFNLTHNDYHQKVDTVKDLEKVWKEFNNRKSTTLPQIVWDQTNTILIDDSYDKSRLQPYNAIHLPDFDDKRWRSKNDNELSNVIEYLRKLRKQNNVSAYIKENPYIPGNNQTLSMFSTSKSSDPEQERNNNCVTF